MRGGKQNTRVLLAALLLFCTAAGAQVKIGEEVGLTANGTVSGGYTGTYGSDVQGSHGFTFGGIADVGGYYYSPNFLSFDINPFYNQSRTNSTFQSVTDATGVAISSNIFAGSHFPGSIQYTNNYNKQGSFAVPGQGDLVTHGNSQALSIVWSANLPDVPSVTAGYTRGNSSYSIFGTESNGGSDFHNLFIHSGYQVAGFNLGGGYNQGAGSATIPQVFAGQPPQSSTSDNKNLNFFASHLLPLGGGSSFSFNRNYLNNDYLGYKFNGTIDTINLTAGVNPTQKWNISFSAGYSDNLSGQLYAATVPGNLGTGGPGGAPTPPVTGLGQSISASSHAWDLEANTNYAFAPNLQMSGQVARREQIFGGTTFASDLFGGGVLYSRPLIGGYITANGFVSDNKLDNSGDNYLSLTTNGSFTRGLGNWRMSVAGGYSQNVQSALISYTTSNYNLNGNLARRFGRFFWTGTAGISHSGLTAQPHTRYASQSYSSGIGFKDISFQANYSQSDGNGLATSAGLTPGPLPPIISPSLLILYGGSSYGFALSGSPIRRLTASATYSKASNNTISQGIFSANHIEEEGLFVQYQFRKVGVTGGYSRLVQGFTASGVPTNFSSFSISVYRWFKFF